MTRPGFRRFAGLTLLLGCACENRESGSGGPPRACFGRTGAGPAEFNYPRAIDIGSDGALVVVDKGGRAQVLSPEGEFLRDWRMPESLAGKPTGLAVGPDGAIYFADTHYSRVSVFAPDGRLQSQFGSFGDGPGQFRLPTDVAIDPRGFIYVGEYGGNDRISKFTLDWQYLLSFGGRNAGAARLERPQSLIVASDGTLWVADACGHRICRFDDQGNLLGTIGSLGDGPGCLRFPYSVALLSDGSLVVCENGNNRVQRFSPQGVSLGVWGRAGREPGQLAYPWAASVGRDDRIYILDSGNNRIQVIRPDEFVAAH